MTTFVGRWVTQASSTLRSGLSFTLQIRQENRALKLEECEKSDFSSVRVDEKHFENVAPDRASSNTNRKSETIIVPPT